MKMALRVLLIDDDEEDYLITLDVLESVPGERHEIRWASSYDEGLTALCAGGYDVCLLDYRLGPWTGLELLREAMARGVTIPIIMLTGLGDEAIDQAAMEVGASEYLLKGQIEPGLLSRTIRYAIRHKASELELKRYAETLEEKNRELTAVKWELEQKNAELLRLDEEKNRFLGMAAHDLRNPLGVILGYSDYLLLMRREEMGPEDAEIVEKIKNSSQFMLSLINDLLDISTIESGKLSLDRSSTDLGELVVANVGLNTVLAARKGIRIQCRYSRDLPRVDVDVRKVEQVLNNLIGNAIQYGSPSSSIEVEVRRAAEDVIVSVADHGPGIAPEDLGKLFKPFGRVGSVSTGGEKSTGLGLAIARRIVEGHGGRIWVESEPGVGSTFSVAFPVAAVADADEQGAVSELA